MKRITVEAVELRSRADRAEGIAERLKIAGARHSDREKGAAGGGHPSPAILGRDRWHSDGVPGHAPFGDVTVRLDLAPAGPTGCTHLTNLLILLVCRSSLAIRTKLSPKR